MRASVESHHHLVSAVMHGAIGLGSKRESDRLRPRGKHQIEGPLGQHFGKRSLAFIDRKCLAPVVPKDRNPSEHALLVIVSKPVVFVESEFAGYSLIDHQREWGRL